MESDSYRFVRLWGYVGALVARPGLFRRRIASLPDFIHNLGWGCQKLYSPPCTVDALQAEGIPGHEINRDFGPLSGS